MVDWRGVMNTVDSDFSQFQFKDNVVQQRADDLTSTLQHVIWTSGAPAAGAYAGNVFHSLRTDSREFRVNNIHRTFAEFTADLTDTTSVHEVATFVDRDVSVEGFSTSVGGLGTKADYYAKCRIQRRGAWDVNYGAAAIQKYIFDGMRVTGAHAGKGATLP